MLSKEFCETMDIKDLLNQGLSHSVIVTDSDGLIHFFNKTSEKMFNMTARESDNLHVSCLIKHMSPDKLDSVEKSMLKLSSNGRTSICFKRSIMVTKDGFEFPARVSVNKAYSKEGVLSFIIFVHDSTDEQIKTRAFVRELTAICAR